MPVTKMLKKKSQKAWKFPVQSLNIVLTHTKRTKMLVQTQTDNWFIGCLHFFCFEIDFKVELVQAGS
jgi:lysozyme family protein